MARIARGIGTFLLIPGIVLLVAGLLAATIGYFGMDAALANHHDGLLSNNDDASMQRAQMGQAMVVAGLAAGAVGLLLSTLGGTIVAFAEPSRFKGIDAT